MESRWTAVPAHVRPALVIVPEGWHIMFRGVLFGNQPGGVVSLDRAGSLLVPVGR